MKLGVGHVKGFPKPAKWMVCSSLSKRVIGLAEYGGVPIGANSMHGRDRVSTLYKFEALNAWLKADDADAIRIGDTG